MLEAKWRRYLRFWRPNIDADVDDELHFHFEERVAELAEAGLTSEEARRAAESEFGDLAAVRRGLREIDRRVHAGRQRASLWERWRQDIAYSARSLRRARALSATVIFTLALGIGVNATVFSVLDRVFLRMPDGIARPEEVRRLYWTARSVGTSGRLAVAQFSIPVAKSVVDALRGSATVAVYRYDTDRFGDETERTTVVTMVDGQYFSVLGVRPSFGRFFTPEEGRIDAMSPVAVVSQRFWNRRFGGSPADAIGQPIVLDKKRYTVVGVAPRDFSGADLDASDVWVPLGMMGAFYASSPGQAWYQSRQLYAFQLLVRPAGAEDHAQLETRATLGARRVFAADARRDSARVLSGPLIAARGPETLQQDVSISIRLGGVALIVLLIACANVANLLLADSVRRRREIAVRSALGISRQGIVRLFLAQSFLLAFLAGAAALIAASWSGALMRTFLFPSVHWTDARMDWRVAVFTGVATLLTGIAAGLAPILRATRTDVSQTLKAGGREGSVQRSRTRAVLVVVQTALSTVLLVGAALFVKSLRAVRALDLGFDVQRIVLVSVHPGRGRGERPEDAAAVAAELPALTERLGRVPGVERVARANMLPMYSFSFSTLFYANGDTLPHWSDGAPGVTFVSPEFFATTGLRVLRGRGLTEHDVSIGNAAVINQALARLTWPNEEAIGQCLRVQTASAPCVTVVGIVENSRRSQLIEEPVRQLYLPLPRSGPDAWATIIVRVPPSRAAAVELAARHELSVIFPDAEVSVRRMGDIVAPQYRPWELGAALFTVFGLLALVVAAVGVFSTLSNEIGQRRHELGVRAALGAGVIDIIRLVVGNGLRVVIVGAAVGTILALAAGRLVASLLYGVAPSDPGVFVMVVAVLLIVGALASALPAWRASRADPLESLRAE